MNRAISFSPVRRAEPLSRPRIADNSVQTHPSQAFLARVIHN
jgi:hypothetical protein